MIKIIPDVKFQTRVRDDSLGGDNPFKWEEKSSSDYFSDKRVILFSLPGAFTPTCSTFQLPDFNELANIQTNPDEAELLRNVQKVVDALSIYDNGDQQRMLECLDVIVGGQILDLQRFGIAKEGGTISALKTDTELDDYAYKVAGCVGVFWTKMSLAHIRCFKNSRSAARIIKASGLHSSHLEI